ncbi:MAG: hypothetical protein ACODAQ_07875 [Phycisphaeraceae bacterium]
MAENFDEKLVQEIVERVLAMVREAQAQQGAASSDGAPAREPTRTHARIQPPAGVCTGDYSKFTELADRPVGAAPANPNAETQAKLQPQPGARSPLALTGIVTAQQLQEAIDAASDGVARLAADARLTPLANDFARQHPEKIQRVSRQTQTAEHSAETPWLWWADGHCPAVQSLTSQLGGRLRPSAAPRSESGLAQIVGDLAQAVGAGQVQGGLLFVRSGARAVCYANRCPALRAVVGTCPESVEQGVTELGANVLVVEYPHVSANTMQAMVQRVLQSSPRPPADVQRHLNELQRGGAGLK